MVPVPAGAAERLLALGDRLSGDHPVVAHEDERPVTPMVLTAWCRRRFGKLHGLRHTHASQLLEAGVNIKAVSRRLGHSLAALTVSTYAPLLPGADQDAALRIDDLLSGSKPGMIGLSSSDGVPSRPDQKLKDTKTYERADQAGDL